MSMYAVITTQCVSNKKLKPILQDDLLLSASWNLADHDNAELKMCYDLLRIIFCIV